MISFRPSALKASGENAFKGILRFDLRIRFYGIFTNLISLSTSLLTYSCGICVNMSLSLIYPLLACIEFISADEFLLQCSLFFEFPS